MSETRQQVLDGGQGGIGLGFHQDPVITLGRHTDSSQIIDQALAKEAGVGLHHIDRGGGATYHGPGQLVIYPAIKITSLKWSIAEFTAVLENVVKDIANLYGIKAHSIPGRPGIYVEGKKLGAIGFHVRRGIVTHGLALNINNDLSYFSLITPCGVVGQQVTSISAIIGKPVDESVLARQAWTFVCHRLGLICGDLAAC